MFSKSLTWLNIELDQQKLLKQILSKNFQKVDNITIIHVKHNDIHALTTQQTII